jgi:hypothetical protein
MLHSIYDEKLQFDMICRRTLKVEHKNPKNDILKIKGSYPRWNIVESGIKHHNPNSLKHWMNSLMLFLYGISD